MGRISFSANQIFCFTRKYVTVQKLNTLQLPFHWDFKGKTTKASKLCNQNTHYHNKMTVTEKWWHTIVLRRHEIPLMTLGASPPCEYHSFCMWNAMTSSLHLISASLHQLFTLCLNHSWSTVTSCILLLQQTHYPFLLLSLIFLCLWFLLNLTLIFSFHLTTAKCEFEVRFWLC